MSKELFVLTNGVVKVVEESSAFINGVGLVVRVSGSMLSESEVKAEILKLFIKRIKNKYTAEDIIEILTDESHPLHRKVQSQIYYSAKDVKRNLFKEQRATRELQQGLAYLANQDVRVDSYMLEEQGNAISKRSIERKNDLVDSLLKPKSAEFVKDYIAEGKDSVIDKYGLSESQFVQKMNNLTRYINKHKDETIEARKEYKARKVEPKMIRFMSTLDNKDLSDSEIDTAIQEQLNESHDYFDDLIGRVANIHKPVELLNDWSGASNQDKYKLINYIRDNM